MKFHETFRHLWGASARKFRAGSKDQWKVEEIKDDSGYLSGRLVALSPWTLSVNGEGQKLRLRVRKSSRRYESMIQSEANEIDLAGGDPHPYGLGVGYPVFREDNIYKYKVYSLPVIIDGRKEEWGGSWTTEYDEGNTLDLYSPREPTSGCIVGPEEMTGGAQWAGASKFRIAIPTQNWGNLVYDFNMTGAREAIAEACRRED